jgi:hypothetical protein
MGKGDPKGGRPRVEFSLETLASMVRIQMTRSECAGVLKVSEKTIDRRLQEETGAGFDAFYKSHSDEGKMSLRRAQFKAAVEDHQPTMLVWMGKQMLGQSDKADLKHSGRVTLNYTPEDNDI